MKVGTLNYSGGAEWQWHEDPNETMKLQKLSEDPQERRVRCFPQSHYGPKQKISFQSLK